MTAFLTIICLVHRLNCLKNAWLREKKIRRPTNNNCYYVLFGLNKHYTLCFIKLHLCEWNIKFYLVIGALLSVVAFPWQLKSAFSCQLQTCNYRHNSHEQKIQFSGMLYIVTVFTTSHLQRIFSMYWKPRCKPLEVSNAHFL